MSAFSFSLKNLRMNQLPWDLPSTDAFFCFGPGFAPTVL
jgi:hypothetical protein